MSCLDRGGGDHAWELVNFRGTAFRNGDPILEVTEQAEWNAATEPAWCYYNNDPANDSIYGKLYNRFAVADARGLAPLGYHVPLLEEWETLILCLGGTDLGSGWWSAVGATMKTTGTLQDNDGLWNSPNVASNESGFSVLPAGCRTSSFVNLSLRGSFWVSDSDTVINFNHATSAVYIGGDATMVGYSIRLRRDATPPDNPPPVIISDTTATATVGQSFSYTVAANNTLTGFGATGLPAGLTLNGTSGLISGMPTAAGTFTVTLTATNTGGTGSASLTLTVGLPPPLPPPSGRTTLGAPVLEYLAQKGYWFVDCDFRDRSDTTVYSGDGVDDLDQLLHVIDRNPKMRMVMDVGLKECSFRSVVRADIVALRAAYVAAWGETTEPAVWEGGLHGRI